MDKIFETLIKNLEKNNMKGYYAKDKAEAFDIAKSLLNDGDVVGVGGSMSLFECGVIDHLRCGKYEFLDRYADNLSRDDINDIYRKSFSADAYLCSTNAITENGDLYNVDGNSNRVACICYGPKSVIMIVGKNKIVKNIDEAARRVKTVAAPKNCDRLNLDTYCRIKGECVSLGKADADMCDGCKGDTRICCSYVVSSYQRTKDRIKVILVDEEIGY